MKTLWVLLATAALAAGCAGGSSISRSDRALEKYEPYIGEPIRGFTAFRIDSWQSVDRDHLILWTGINDAWLITIGGSCPDLMFTDRIRVTSTGSQISTFDKVIVRGDTCLIDTIQPINIRQMKADREQ
ncbi:MAG TPA: DUF6491 family protein [Steroidobacteraceae bacterium]|nr:DUF6491 family protein [Steroidobacteraceae bacterium]